MSTRQGDKFIGELRAKALKEKRRIVAFSQHEKRVCRKFYGIDLSPAYADARLIAMKWRKKTYPGLKPRPKISQGVPPADQVRAWKLSR